MVNKKQVLAGVAGVAAAVTGAAAAQASDLPSKSSPKAPAPSAGNWDGFYVGGSLNYDAGAHTYYDSDYDMDGMGVGAFAGYNHQMGSMVVGVEVAANYMSLNDSTTYNYSVDSSIDLKAKLGADMNGYLLYALAGGSITSSGGYDAYEYNDFGVNVGLGVATKLKNNVSLGLEYVVRLSQQSYEQDDYEGVKSDINTLSVRAAYHF